MFDFFLGGKMDITMLNVISICISGLGIIGAITKFNHKNLYKTVWDSNFFQKKARIVDDYVQIVFTVIVFIGLAVQFVSIIFSDKIPERIHSEFYYFMFICLTLLLTIILGIGLLYLSKFMARRKWAHGFVIELSKSLSQIEKMINPNGKRSVNDEHDNTNTDTNQPSYQSGEKELIFFEELFEIKPKSNDLNVRLGIICKYFESHKNE
jgi:hypothetical protein